MKMSEQIPNNDRVKNALAGLGFIVERLKKMHKLFYKQISAGIIEDYIKNTGLDKNNLSMKDDPFFLYCIFLAGAAIGSDHIDDKEFAKMLASAVGFARELRNVANGVSTQNMTMN
jgi:hypothetical protein